MVRQVTDPANPVIGADDWNALQGEFDAKQPLAEVLTNTTASFTTAQETKLAGIEAGAEVNTVDSVAGKTGVVTLAKSDVGLGNVDNTSDVNKPISTATQTALDAKFELPALTTGSVLFSNGSTIAQDNTNLFWDDANNRLGVGTQDFGSGGHTYQLAVSGNIAGARIYSSVFRDVSSGNTWVSLTGTSPNQTLAVGNTGVATTNFVSKASTGVFSFDNSVAIGKASPSYKLDVYGTTAAGAISANMGYNIARVATPPATMTRTVVAGSGLEIGTYWYRVVYYNAIGNSTPSAAMSAVTTAGNQRVNLSTIPISSDPSVIGRKIYRSRVGDGSSYGGLIATIADNTTTTYTDTTPDASVLPAVAAARSIYANANFTTNYISVDGVRSMILDESLTTFGYQAGSAITVAAKVTLIGTQAGKAITYGSLNTIVGANSGVAITTGDSNTVIGADCLVTGTNPLYNIAIGRNVLYANNSSHNIAMGYFTGTTLTGGSNIYLGGYIASSGTWSGNNNIAIGVSCAPLSGTASNQLNLGHLIYGTGVNSTSKKVFIRNGSAQSGNIFEIQDSGGTPTVAVDSAGKLGVNQATPTALVDIDASTTARASLRIRSGVAPSSPNDGDIWFDGTDLKMRIGGVTKTFVMV